MTAGEPHAPVKAMHGALRRRSGGTRGYPTRAEGEVSPWVGVGIPHTAVPEFLEDVMRFPDFNARQSKAFERFLKEHGSCLLEDARHSAHCMGRGIVGVIFAPGTFDDPSVEYLDAEHPDYRHALSLGGPDLASRLEAYDPQRELVYLVMFDNPAGISPKGGGLFRGVCPHEVPLDDRELVEREMDGRGRVLRPRSGLLTGG